MVERLRMNLSSCFRTAEQVGHIWCTCFQNGHKKAEMYWTTWPEFPKNEVVKSSWDPSTATSALRTKQNEKCWSEIQLHTILQINYWTFILNPEQRRVFQLVIHKIQETWRRILSQTVTRLTWTWSQVRFLRWLSGGG